MNQFSFFGGASQPQVDTSNLTGLLSSIQNLPSSQQQQNFTTKFVNYDPSQDGMSVGSEGAESMGPPSTKKGTTRKRTSKGGSSSSQPKKKKKKTTPTSKKKQAAADVDEDDEDINEEVNIKKKQDVDDDDDMPESNPNGDEFSGGEDDNDDGDDDDDDNDDGDDDDDTPKKKSKRKSKGDSKESSGRKKTELAPHIRQMMYGFGDVKNPLPETVTLMEELVREYVHEIVSEALKISKKGRLNPEDLVFLIRHDAKKYLRVDELLRKYQEIKKARDL